VAMLTTLKGIPTGYQKDLQENNLALFEAMDRTTVVVGLLEGVVAGLRPQPDRMAAALDAGTRATDLADLLVQAGLPFRDAHTVVGRLVRRAEELGVELDAVPAEQVRALDPRLEASLAALGGAEAAVERRQVEGGTARRAVQNQLERARDAFAS
jgi:argininosuccinate lyase